MTSLLFSKIKCLTDSTSPSLTASNKLAFSLEFLNLLFFLFFSAVVVNDVVDDVVKVVSEVVVAAAVATAVAFVVCAFAVAPLVTGSSLLFSVSKKATCSTSISTLKMRKNQLQLYISSDGYFWAIPVGTA